LKKKRTCPSARSASISNLQKKLEEKKDEQKLTGPSARHWALAKVHDEIMYIFMFFEHLFLKKKSHFRVAGLAHIQTER